MSLPDLPDFDQAVAVGPESAGAETLAECHGIACGLLVCEPGSSGDDFIRLLQLLEAASEPGPALRDILLELHAVTARQVADDQMRLALWLPGDEEPLERRTRALAQWCNGFLAAVGVGDGGRVESLSEEAAEALADLQQIALAEVEFAEGDDHAAVEEEEQAFAEIVEYVRVAVLMLSEELRGPAEGESIH